MAYPARVVLAIKNSTWIVGQNEYNLSWAPSMTTMGSPNPLFTKVYYTIYRIFYLYKMTVCLVLISSLTLDQHTNTK